MRTGLLIPRHPVERGARHQRRNARGTAVFGKFTLHVQDAGRSLRATACEIRDAAEHLGRDQQPRVPVGARGSGSDAVEHTVTRVLRPSSRWSDRRWRSLDLMIPTAAGGEAVVTLETRSEGGGSAVASRGAISRRMAQKRIRAQAPHSWRVRRLREWGLRGTIAYARGRGSAEDQAAAYARWISLNTPDERALWVMRQGFRHCRISP